MNNLPENAMAGIRQANSLFETEVIGSRNFEVLDEVYTADARIMPPGAPMISGRDNIKAFWKTAAANLGVVQATLTTVDAEALGDRIFEIGKAQLMLSSGHSAEVKYVVQWKMEDGKWKWHVDIWSPNM